jgi:hypothetical protein
MRLLLLIVAEAAASSSSQGDGNFDALIEEVEWDDGQYAEELEGVSSGEVCFSDRAGRSRDFHSKHPK